eukprot:scaffold1213_cov208-Alexandrium_tamarense.AAC.15
MYRKSCLQKSRFLVKANQNVAIVTVLFIASCRRRTNCTKIWKQRSYLISRNDTRQSLSVWVWVVAGESSSGYTARSFPCCVFSQGDGDDTTRKDCSWTTV